MGEAQWITKLSGIESSYMSNICQIHSKCVPLLYSSFFLLQPLDKARRWDKTTKAFTGSDINRPVALKTYNEKKMDGVDQLDDTKTVMQ